MKKPFLLIFVLLPMLAVANLIPVQHKNGKWGFKESENSEQFVIKPQFAQVGQFVNGHAFVWEKGSYLWGVINTNGKFVITPQYRSVKHVANNCYVVLSDNGKKGVFNLSECRDVISAKYDDVIAFKSGEYLLKMGDHCYMVDESGNVKYNVALPLPNNLFAVLSDKWEFMNVDGEMVEQPGNTLLYTSKDNEIVSASRSFRNDYFWKTNVVSDVCYANQGLAVFDKPLTSIGKYAFWCFDRLVSVSIPRGVTEVAESAFAYCSSLVKITIPDSVTSIGASAFYNCISLTGITFPGRVKSIGNRAFENCTSLAGITTSSGITSIGGFAFSGCTSLTSVTVSDSVASIDAFLSGWCKINFDGYLANPFCYGARLYHNGSELTDIVIPHDVAAIKSYAFYGCASLERVTIGNSVTSIGGSAFKNCTALKTVYCNPTEPPILGFGVFDCDKGSIRRDIYVPSNSHSKYRFADGWINYVNSIHAY